MKKKEVQAGRYYAIRHHKDPAHRLSVIRLDGDCSYGGYNATKLNTGRTIRIKSAAKLRFEVENDPITGAWVKKATV
jgi:hypothetical protein